MSKAKLVLVPSELMDTNKKTDRNEHKLIRMSKLARDTLGFDKSVEIFMDTNNTGDRLNSSLMLDIHQAFSKDIKQAHISGLSDDELSRVGFVTSMTFKRITGSIDKVPKKNLWITDSVEDIVVGADPEFVLFDENDNIVNANGIMNYLGVLGSDGAMAEIRPSPAISPEELTDNIKQILNTETHTKDIVNYRWVAGCYFKNPVRDFPVGGHIHIGNPSQIGSMSYAVKDGFFKTFNKIMDELLAVPLTKIDGTDLGRARRTGCKTGNYGFFGGFRVCNGRLEYRTLSGMWLMHPILTTIVFGTAKAIIDEIYRLSESNNFDHNYLFSDSLYNVDVWREGFNGWKDIPLAKDMGCVASSGSMIDLLHFPIAESINGNYIRRWMSKMKKLSTYNKYSMYIDELGEVLRNKTEVFRNCSKDLKRNWIEDGTFLI